MLPSLNFGFQVLSYIFSRFLQVYKKILFLFLIPIFGLLVLKSNLVWSAYPIEGTYAGQLNYISWTGIVTEASEITTIDFITFPDGTQIPDETPIINQFEPLGVIFTQLFPNSPRVKTDLGGILISGGPTGFFDDIKMEFVGTSLPKFVTVEIIGSGLGISAELQAFNPDGILIGTISHTYTGPSGQLSPFTFFAPSGETIASVLYNGGLNPTAAASIGTLIFGDCNYSINPSSSSHGSGAETGNVIVTAPTGCNWNATSNASWINITSGESGSGNGTVNYSVEANTNMNLRTGTMTIAGQTFTVTQAGMDSTGPSLSITSHTDGQHVTIPSITLAGTASDSGLGDNGISQVTVNGSRADNDTATESRTAYWSKVVNLNQGENLITVIAYDNSETHNQNTLNITVYYDVPDILVSHTYVNFGSVNVGSMSSPQTVMVSNGGMANLEIGTIEITDNDASEFSILNDSCSGQTIAPSETCIVDVRFSPKSGTPERFSMVEYFRQAMSLLTPTGYKQKKSTILNIPSNDPDTLVLEVALSGKGYSSMMQRILDLQKFWQRSLFPSGGR